MEKNPSPNEYAVLCLKDSCTVELGKFSSAEEAIRFALFMNHQLQPGIGLLVQSSKETILSLLASRSSLEILQTTYAVEPCRKDQ